MNLTTGDDVLSSASMCGCVSRHPIVVAQELLNRLLYSLPKRADRDSGRG